MLKYFKKSLKKFKEAGPADPWFLFSAIALLLIGLVMLSSASAVISYNEFANTYHYFFKQLVAVIIGFFAFMIFYFVDYRVWRKLAIWSLFASIILLILVFIPGLSADYGTSRSWIVILGQSFQPAELVKFTYLIYLATWLEAKKGQLHKFGSGIFPFIFSLCIISSLMMAQPDFGTLFIILFSSFVAFFVAGGNLSHILITFLIGLLGLGLLLYIGTSYRSDRFLCYQDPNYSNQNECYQISQSLIAVGSGSWLGRGLGESRQKFMYLPELWGDSIFPIIAEEIGFIFSSLLIVLFGILFYRGLKIARYAPDVYGTALAVGIVAWLFIQTFLNIGGMINLIPMTGVPLPFISAGGSSILALAMAIGILANISKHTRYAKKK